MGFGPERTLCVMTISTVPPPVATTAVAFPTTPFSRPHLSRGSATVVADDKSMLPPPLLLSSSHLRSPSC